MTAVLSKKPKLLEAGHSDLFQTPASALDPLLAFIPPGLIWEPACGKGKLVDGLAAAGRAVIGTDILGGHDFLTFSPALFDVIVSNPPFSLKDEFLARCYELKKPFALLLPLTVFDSVKRQRLFHENGVQMLFMPRRVKFETPNGAGSSSWFMTAWICGGFNLPRDLTFSGMELQ